LKNYDAKKRKRRQFPTLFLRKKGRSASLSAYQLSSCRGEYGKMAAKEEKKKKSNFMGSLCGREKGRAISGGKSEDCKKKKKVSVGGRKKNEKQVVLLRYSEVGGG